MFPTIKKKLSSFLLSEEGKISKHGLLGLGSLISAAVIGGVLFSKGAAAATHINSLQVSYSAAQQVALGTHGHHSSSTSDCVNGNDCGGACSSSGVSACSACGSGACG